MKVISVILALFLSTSIFSQKDSTKEETIEPTNNWNQWNISPITGLSEGMFKLSIGGMYSRPNESQVIHIVSEFEYMFSDRFGLTGELALPISSESLDTRDYPAMLGGNLHLLPRFNFDAYLGGKGGFTYIRPESLLEKLVPTVELHVGMSLYFWGIWFVQAEGGVAFYSYGDNALFQDHSTPRGSFKTGFFF